jgi:lactate permease
VLLHTELGWRGSREAGGSVGVSTSKYVRDEGQVIRHNLGWTLVLLGWLILVGLLYYFFLPGFMQG